MPFCDPFASGAAFTAAIPRSAVTSNQTRTLRTARSSLRRSADARQTPFGRCVAAPRTSMGVPEATGPRDDDPRSDEVLMAAYRDGNVRAFELLVFRHRKSLFNFLLRSVHNRSRAEELLQEVFVRIIRAKDRYEISAKFTTWAYTIARNLTVDESRRARFRDHVSLDAPRRGCDGEAGRSLIDVKASQEVGTDERADAPRLLARVQQALDELPAEQREVFVLREISNLSFKDIGDILGAPENTVKSRMRYALEKLREALADIDPRDPPVVARPHAQASSHPEESVHG